MLKTTNVMSPRASVVARLPVTAPPSQTASLSSGRHDGREWRDHAQEVRVEDEQEEGEAQEVEPLALGAQDRLVDRVAHVLQQSLEEALQARGLPEGVPQLARQVEHAGQHEEADRGHEDEMLGDGDGCRWKLPMVNSGSVGERDGRCCR